MIDAFFGRLFRRWGPDYPFRAACLVLFLGHLVAIFGVAMLAFQFGFDRFQFLFALGLVEGLMLIDNLISASRLKRHLRPVRGFLAGEQRGEESLKAAWRSLVGLPTLHFRRAVSRTIIGTLLPLVAWVTWDQQLPLWGSLLLFLAGLVVLFYGFLLRFLVLEVAWRPALMQIATLPEAAIDRNDALSTRQLTLKARLLIGIPLINLITATVVATFSGTGGTGLENLGTDAIVTVLVATTISLGLSLLFSQSVLLPLGDLRIAAKEARSGDFNVRVPVMGADEVGRLAVGFNTLMSGMEERGRLETALETFSDPAVVEAIKTEDAEALVASEVDVTVMFVDVLGFTEFAERTTPKAVVDRLTEYFDIVVPAVERNGGHVNQMFADGLMAVFGAPDPLPGHPDRAVDAAMEIAWLLDARFAGLVQVGIGINSGPAVSGAIGGGGSARFTVIGDTVNTAERVERATRETGDRILISGATHSRLARDHGGFDSRPAVPMKGKSSQVRLWAPSMISTVSGVSRLDFDDVAAVDERDDG